jgi:hypothetical protein
MRRSSFARVATFLLAGAFLLALPGAVFAAPDAAAVGDNITVEYRYAEGEAPDIPASISQFGQTYNLVGTSDAVLESTLPTLRTYTYRVSGALTLAQLAEIQGAGDIAFTPVYLDNKEEADRYLERTVPTNDVEELPAPAVVNANEFAGTFPDGSSFSASAIAGVEFEELPLDAFKIPTGFKANILYRGILTTPVIGYYLASANFSTSEVEDETNQYIVVAEYAPEALPPLGDEEEALVEEEEVLPEPAEPEAALPTTGLSDADVALVDSQGNNPLANIANGLTPLGGTSVQGVWSFLSLILSVVAIVIAIAYALGALARRSRVKTYENIGVYDNEALALAKKRGNLLRILTILFGVLTLVTWLILDDFTVGMVWINANTVIVAVFFIVTVVLCALTRARHAKADRYATEEPDTDIA